MQGSPTLQILRTPMPFGSPVPYPHSIDGTASLEVVTTAATAEGLGSMRPSDKGIPCLPYTLPFELRCLPWDSLRGAYRVEIAWAPIVPVLMKNTPFNFMTEVTRSAAAAGACFLVSSVKLM